MSTNDDRSEGNEKKGVGEKEYQNNKFEKKAATRVQELHKLQEIACLSDAKLLYADVQKQIKKSTVTTLKGFVAMETKPIHNSVKQRANRVVIVVKSIIGWIRTGGINNNISLKIIFRRFRTLTTESVSNQ